MRHTKTVILLSMIIFCLIGCANPATTTLSVSIPSATISPTLPPTVISTVTPTLQPTEDLNLSSAEMDAGFRMSLPAELPKDYAFKEISYWSEQQALTASYFWDDPGFTGELLFITQQLLEPDATWDVETDIETIQVGEHEVTIVRGDWWEEEWQKDAPVTRLLWEDDGYFYTIMYLYNETFSPGYLREQSLIKLVEQMLGL